MVSQYPTYKYTDYDAKNQLARFERLDHPNGYPFDNFHAHEYNEILVFTKGGGTHNINFKNYEIRDNSIHLLAANDLHWAERSMDSTGFAIIYKDQFLHKLQMVNPDIDFHNIFSNSKVINLTQEEANSFEFIFREMLENKTQSAYMLQVIGTFIAKITTLNYQTSTTEKIYDPLIAKVLGLIEKHYKSRMTITEYAAMLHIAPRTLQNRIKKVSGMTLNELQQERILKEAKRLLCTSQMNVKEIAGELGFNETAHFTHWFKKKTEYLPTEYKYGN